jgi:hypothetical protein
MLRKMIVVAGVALLATLLSTTQVQAWGAAHVGYTHVGYGGVQHYGRTVAAGPYGAYSGAHYGSYGVGGAYHTDYHYGTGYGGYSYGAYHYGATPSYSGYAYYGGTPAYSAYSYGGLEGDSPYGFYGSGVYGGY